MKTKKFKETRRIYADSVRQLCVNNKYYTRGTSEEYKHLLNDLCALENIIGTEQLQVIAEDIVSHSKFDDELLLEEDYVPTVMWELAKYCYFSCFS